MLHVHCMCAACALICTRPSLHYAQILDGFSLEGSAVAAAIAAAAARGGEHDLASYLEQVSEWVLPE